MKAEELGQHSMHPAHRASLTQRITPQNVMQHILPLHKGQKESSPASRHASRPASPRAGTARFEHDTPRDRLHPNRAEDGGTLRGTSSSRMHSSGYTPFLESVDRNMKDSPMGNMKLPSHLTTEDFTRAVAAATVSALRHQSSVISQSASGHKPRAANISAATEEEEHEGGGHESPNWTRGVSTGVLLGCTVLFAMIAGMSPCSPFFNVADIQKSWSMLSMSSWKVLPLMRNSSD
jgi:Ca2+:H+ antiporter